MMRGLWQPLYTQRVRSSPAPLNDVRAHTRTLYVYTLDALHTKSTYALRADCFAYQTKKKQKKK